jgi:DNA-binding CsgD family transcriptional regulator
VKRARVSVDPPTAATTAVHRTVQGTPELGDAVLLSGGIDPDDPTELFSIAGERETVLEGLDREGIRSVDVLSSENEETYVYVREGTARDSRIADAFTAGTLVTTLPVRFRSDGSVEFTVLGAGEDLQSAVRTAEAVADVTVLSVREGYSGEGDGLTSRQREVLRVAREEGYYDAPREATQEAIAERLDVAPSTVAEHLRKAEATLVDRALGE